MNFSIKLLLTSLSLFLISVGPLSIDQIDEKRAENKGTLVHNIYFYLNEDVTAEEKEQFEAGLKTLLKITKIHEAEMGVPAQTAKREVTDHDFVYSITLHFKTLEDYETYAEHPDHMKFIQKYSHLWADVKV